MDAAPIQSCKDWPELVAALAGRPEFRGLAELRPTLASAVLAAPAAIARSIAARAPQLAQRAELSVMVIGAESTDAVDRGRWYQAIAAMLDSRVGVRATLVGASLDAAFASAAAPCAPATAADCARGDLNQYLDAHPQSRFDVAVLFQPGFQKYRDWLQDHGFARLLAAGTLLFGTSNGDDEYQMERRVLECHGYRASAEVFANPFYLELGDARSSIRWGGVLWQIEAPPPPGFVVDEQGRAALDTLTRMVMHSMTVVGAPSPPCGAMVELTAGNGMRKAVIHVFDQRFVDPASGAILQLKDGGELAAIGQMPAAELARYPRAAARELERALWAADIKSRFLLATYPAAGDAATGAAIARSMFDDMRARAASLFKS